MFGPNRLTLESLSSALPYVKHLGGLSHEASMKDYVLEDRKHWIKFRRISPWAYTVADGCELGLIDSSLWAAGWTKHKPRSIDEYSRFTYGDALIVMYQSLLILAVGAELVNGEWPPAHWGVRW